MEKTKKILVVGGARSGGHLTQQLAEALKDAASVVVGEEFVIRGRDLDLQRVKLLADFLQTSNAHGPPLKGKKGKLKKW